MISFNQKLKILVFVLIAFSVAKAEVTSLTLSAKVKSFDQSHVLLESSAGRIFTVARATIKQKSLHSGQPLLVTLQGDEIKAFESAAKK